MTTMRIEKLITIKVESFTLVGRVLKEEEKVSFIFYYWVLDKI